MTKQKPRIPAWLGLVVLLLLSILPKFAPDPVEKLALAETPPWMDARIIETVSTSHCDEALEALVRAVKE